MLLSVAALTAAADIPAVVPSTMGPHTRAYGVVEMPVAYRGVWRVEITVGGKTSTRYLHVASAPRDVRLIEPRADGALVEVACAAEVTVAKGRPSLLLTGAVRQRYRVDFLPGAAGRARISHGGRDLIWVGELTLERLADPKTVLNKLRIRYLECDVAPETEGYGATVTRGPAKGKRFTFTAADPARVLGVARGAGRQALFVRTLLGETLSAEFDLAALK